MWQECNVGLKKIHPAPFPSCSTFLSWYYLFHHVIITILPSYYTPAIVYVFNHNKLRHNHFPTITPHSMNNLHSFLIYSHFLQIILSLLSVSGWLDVWSALTNARYPTTDVTTRNGDPRPQRPLCHNIPISSSYSQCTLSKGRRDFIIPYLRR